MSNNMFYCDIESNDSTKGVIELLTEYAQSSSSQVYIINAPLNVEDDAYDYKYGAAILIPKHKILLVDFSNDCDEFKDYCEDFIEDLGYLSEKYDYKMQLGRPRLWRNKLVESVNVSELDSIEDIINKSSLDSVVDQRNADYLISLLIGSINDINRIGGQYPDTLLDQVKKKIILFDGDQSRFIYSDSSTSKRITIQGLAGTGKTELLLHKLKDLYLKDKDCKIAFTCFNRILARSMKKRVPEFFNFMRVEEQIEWDKRLWVMSSWGSEGRLNSGVYAYICSFYGLKFHSYAYNRTFDDVCKIALSELHKKSEYDCCFDYVLIDESQDFPESFFQLCEKVTKKNVYLAGDIFQDIYDCSIDKSVKSDYLLNKCYRTDPRTLMFAHAVGMGLYEKPVIRWLNDEEWESCGYIVNRQNNNFSLSRIPLRRFEDVDLTEVNSIEVIGYPMDSVEKKIFEIIDDIRDKNPTVEAGDIAIVFLEGSSRANYQLADYLAMKIDSKYDWKAVKGYEVKDKVTDAVFISNRNNIKGLEFPFVICLVRGRITDNVFSRNTIYMMLTRSFITSYLVINNYSPQQSLLEENFNGEFIDVYSKAAESICSTGIMQLREPPQSEKEQQNQKVSIAVTKQRSAKDVVEGVINKFPQLSAKNRKRILVAMMELIGDEGVMTEYEIQDRTQKMISAFI